MSNFENKDCMEDLKELECMAHDLTSFVKSHISAGLSECNCDELDKAINSIHHLKESVRNCYEALYYKTVIEAMENGDETEYYGYNNRRYNNGHYAPKGSGHISGYMPPMMGYDMMPPSGYNQNLRDYPHVRNYVNDRLGYHDENDSRTMTSENGRAFDDYRMAKRHYTETGSPSDKEEMKKNMNEHFANSINTMREMWYDAEPEHRKRMKADLTKFIGELPV